MKSSFYKKALVSAIMASASASAVAADSVTLYGVVGVGVGSDRIKYQGRSYSSSGLRSDLSLFGFRGKHELENGYAVNFQLESGFDSMSGRGSKHYAFGRMATLGVSHKEYGAIDVGRHYNASALYMGDVDPFGGGYGLSGADSTISTGMRVDNLVLYQTPKIGGWEAAIGYSSGIDDVEDAEVNKKILEKNPNRRRGRFFADHQKTRLFTAGAMYSDGPLKLVATYDMARGRGDAPDKTHKRRIQAYLLGASYQFDALTAYVNFSQTFNGWLSGKNLKYMPTDERGRFSDLRYADGFRGTSGMIGLSYKVGVHTLMASWQRSHANSRVLNGHHAPFNVYSLGYRYNLSKRTHLRANVNYATNYAFVDGLRGQSVNLAMRHAF